MNCENCSAKMKCRYSKAVGERLRYRVYRCPYCQTFLETVELPVTLFESGHRNDDVLKRVAEGKRSQMYFATRHTKGKRVGGA